MAAMAATTTRSTSWRARLHCGCGCCCCCSALIVSQFHACTYSIAANHTQHRTRRTRRPANSHLPLCKNVSLSSEFFSNQEPPRASVMTPSRVCGALTGMPADSASSDQTHPNRTYSGSSWNQNAVGMINEPFEAFSTTRRDETFTFEYANRSF